MARSDVPRQWSPWRERRQLLPSLLRHLPELAMAVLLLVSAALLAATGGFGKAYNSFKAVNWDQPANPSAMRLSLNEIRQVGEMNVTDEAQIVVEGAAAQERNQAIPVSGVPIENPGRFLISASYGDAGYVAALKCLSQAVYYEAAFEPAQGRRAVAQVVLNRMRHPAYPKSVCGVVYQGAERRTGCQFSFTCDGSLARVPAAGAWRQSEDTARAALTGFIETSVGTATHYHADYVLPKWAFRLGKIGQLGRHIFYRFPGDWGQAKSFRGRYDGQEFVRPAGFEVSGTLDGGTTGAENTLPSGLAVPADVTDRHSETDVGGRLDPTKGWRPSISQDETQALPIREAMIASETPAAKGKVAMADEIAAASPQ